MRNDAGLDNIGVAYLYCDCNDTQRQTVVQLLSSIVKQLAEQSESLASVVLKFCSQLEKQKRPSSADALVGIIEQSAQHFQRVFILVDALVGS